MSAPTLDREYPGLHDLLSPLELTGPLLAERLHDVAGLNWAKRIPVELVEVVAELYKAGLQTDQIAQRFDDARAYSERMGLPFGGNWRPRGNAPTRPFNPLIKIRQEATAAGHRLPPPLHASERSGERDPWR